MSMEFSNQVVDITCRSFEDFHKAMSFFFRRSHEKVKAYAIDPKKGMILYWYIEDHGGGKPGKTSGGAPIQMLPYEMNFESAVQFAWHWLQTTERGPQPDHDGDNKPGFRVYNEQWTHVDEDHSALVGIQPVWAMYGK